MNNKNTKIMKSIVGEIKKTSFNGIIIVASNPVDIMTYVVWKASGYDKTKVMDPGTTLDTARLRFGLGERLGVHLNLYMLMLWENMVILNLLHGVMP